MLLDVRSGGGGEVHPLPTRVLLRPPTHRHDFGVVDIQVFIYSIESRGQLQYSK